MSFQISGLPAEPFQRFFGQSDAALAARGIRRYVADRKPGFPCRVSLQDALPGETVLLLNYKHQPAATPYRATHAIFVREAARAARLAVGELPEVVLPERPFSVRAYDQAGMMVDADLAPGAALTEVIERMLGRPEVAYLHLHNARQGCYAARVDRA